MSIRQKLLILPLFFVLAASLAAAAQERPDCAPAAQVFDVIICREDVAVEQQHIEAIKQQYESQGLDSEKALRNRNEERLREKIWDVALGRKFGNEIIEPDEREVGRVTAALRDSIEHGHKRNLENAARIKELLDSGAYGPEEEARMRSLLQKIETGLAFYEEREQYKKELPPEFEEMVREAERNMTAAMIREWKINRELYKAYGGRLVDRGGVVEPVDAIGKFLSYIRTEGRLKILDPEFEDVFASTDTFVAGPHEPLPPEAAEVFADPEGQFDIGN